MKIRIKYTLESLEDGSIKTSTKTFSRINEAAESEGLIDFSKAYLGLIDAEGYRLKFTLYKSNDTLVYDGNL